MPSDLPTNLRSKTDSETIAQAEETLRTFWQEMYTWENDGFPRLIQNMGNMESLARALEEIYAHYLVPKDRMPGRITVGADGKRRCDLGAAPEYDPRRETIVGHEVKNNKTLVITTELANHLKPDLKTPQRY